MIVNAVALATSVLGRTVLAVRLPTALASASTVFVVFWLGRVLFGRNERFDGAPRRGATEQDTPWRGLLIGGIGAGLLAVSLNQTLMGRTALRGNFLPLVLCLCLALLWRGWQERSWPRVALAGACAGLLAYTYIAARFTPFVFLLFGLSLALPLRSVTWTRVRAASLKRNLPWVVIFVGVAGLVAAPMLLYFAQHPVDFFVRGSQLSVFDPSVSQGDPLGSLLFNVREHLLVLGFRSDPNWNRSFGQPMLNPWEAFFFWLGVGMAVWRWQQRPPYRLLLIWLVALILPAMLAREAGLPPRTLVPNTLRMIGAGPAVYLLIGVGVWEALRFLKERCCGLHGRAGLIYRENQTGAAIAVGVLVSGAVLVQGVTTYRTCFQEWANTPELYRTYESEWTDLARGLNSQPSAGDMVYLIPSFYGHYSFEYLYQGAASIQVFNMGMADLAAKIESTLAALEDVSIVKLVEWNTNGAWITDDTAAFAFLLGKYGSYLGSEEYADFKVYNYVDISLDRTWTYYDYLEPLTVHYDGGISLHGLALGQGEEQLSTQHLLNLGEERSLWGVLQWQTSPGLDIDYAISLRLHNAEGERVYQADDVLWDPTNHTPTSQWSTEKMVDTLVQLEIPADIAPGEYELRMVVYNFETQVPTVQVGVWEPEVVLARLRLAEGR